MPTIVHKLGERDWKRLRDMYKGGFLHGGCCAFAIAVHEGLGWPLVGLFVKNGETEGIDHAGVRSPDGKIFDIRGFLSEEDFGKLYTKPPYDVREVTKNSLLEFKPPPVYELAIQHARRVAETLWPELPWKNSSISRVIAYVDALEALSREHKQWIRTSLPIECPPNESSEPLVTPEAGGEKGYGIRPTIDGMEFLISRYF